jgi:sugar phosphate isomerase/epimerase
MTLQISRRQFLSRGAVVAAATVLLPELAFPFPLGLPPGIQLYTVNADIAKDAPAALAQIAAIGYKEVEPAGFGSLKTAAAFRKALDDNGLHCPSAHLNFDVRDLGKSFDDAHALGCTYATSSLPRRMLQSDAAQPARMSPMSEDDVKRLAEVLNKVGASARATGLTYASHNHGFEFEPMGNATAYDYLLQHTDPALVMFEIDCGWTNIAGKDPIDFLRRYPGRFKMIHMSDYLPLTPQWEKSTIPPGAELGSGFIPYRNIIAHIRNQGIEHVFVEQAGPFPRVSQMQAAKIDYAYLKTFTQ